MREQPRDHRHHPAAHHQPPPREPGAGLTQTVDTIVAVATPVGEAGLGVVRLSGPSALLIASRLFSKPLQTALTHTLHHGWIRRNGARIDEAVAGVFRAPASYTGDDVVEFSCHGSPSVLREVVHACQDEGARLARPGEYTERAYLNGKLDLAQAEAVASLISARSSGAARAAVNQLSGGLSRLLGDLRVRLISLVAEIEANLDFVEEDIPNVPQDRMKDNVRGLLGQIEELLASASRGRVLRDGARVVLAGRPNVGKSSLFNALLAEDRAIVTDVPGTTRDVLEERVDWSGCPVTLADTAGLRASGDAVEAIGAERARRAHGAADVAILVVDAAEGVTDDDAQIAAALSPRPFVVALNKSDRAGGPADAARLRGLSVVPTSAVARTGLDDLRRAVLAALPGDGAAADAGTVVTSERHAERLAAAHLRLLSALQALEEGRSEEAVSADLRSAAVELAAVTGEDVGEAVLDAIFRQFCIGK